MALPRPPHSASQPIPNQPFASEERWYIEGNQGALPLGQGLYIDARTGEFTNVEPSPYIYCTPAYPELPPSSPPYSCETEVNTAGVTDFTEAWYNCQYLTEFPCVDSSSVTDFSYAWEYCYGLTSFPSLNTSAGENFTYSWAYTGLTSFPVLNLSKGVDFYGAWAGCYYMIEFPALDLSKGEIFTSAWANGYEEGLQSFPALDLSSGKDFKYAWEWQKAMVTFGSVNVSSGENFYQAWSTCESLTSFPAGMFDNCSATNFNYAWIGCALSQQSVDNILVSLDTAGQSNGIVSIDGGTSSAPGAAGLSAKASLEGKGWTVLTN